MPSILRHFFLKLFGVLLDVIPLVLVIAFFQLFVLKTPFPHLERILIGMVLVILGLFLFILGLEASLFPIGESMANQFAIKGNVFWIILFGFALGFSTTLAEPALTIIAKKAGELAAQAGVIVDKGEALNNYVWGLRITVALSVGLAIAIGVLRIIKGWPLIWFILAGYALVVIATLFAPQQIVGIAYDSGGITTSTITVPLVTALGLGLATSIRGRHPVMDGFGLIALASLFPIVFVILYGILIHGVG
ncbi:MAG: DUF1538 family protein [Nitrospinales bacterium]